MMAKIVDCLNSATPRVLFVKAAMKNRPVANMEDWSFLKLAKNEESLLKRGV